MFWSQEALSVNRFTDGLEEPVCMFGLNHNIL